MAAAVHVARFAVDIPADGAFTEIPAAGVSIVIEDAPDEAAATRATVHVHNKTGDGLPAITRAQYHVQGGFDRFYLRGAGGAAGTVWFVVHERGLRIEFPYHG